MNLILCSRFLHCEIIMYCFLCSFPSQGPDSINAIIINGKNGLVPFRYFRVCNPNSIYIIPNKIGYTNMVIAMANPNGVIEFWSIRSI